MTVRANALLPATGQLTSVYLIQPFSLLPIFLVLKICKIFERSCFQERHVTGTAPPAECYDSVFKICDTTKGSIVAALPP